MRLIKFFLLKILVVAGGALLLLDIAKAQTTTIMLNQNSPSTSIQAPLPETNNQTKQKKWTLGLSTTAMRNLYTEPNGKESRVGVLGFSANYEYSSLISFSSALNTYQSFETDRTTSINNLPLTATLSPQEISHDLYIEGSLSFILPTNEKSRKEDTFHGALQLNSNFSWKPLKGLSIATGVELIKNSHQYKQDIRGEQNISHSITPYLASTYKWNHVSLTVNTGFDHAYNYNNRLSTSFSVGESLSIELNKQTSFTLGHSNEASLLAANGADSNFKFFDNKTSIVYVAINFTN